jgi:hypothetical protein
MSIKGFLEGWQKVWAQWQKSKKWIFQMLYGNGEE